MVRSGDKRFLDGVLGFVEITESSSQRAEDARRQIAQQVLEIGCEVQRAPPVAVSR
jgi:hypothetical protein